MDTSDFQVIGKGFDDTQNRYERLTASLKGKTRPEVWNLSKNSSGLTIRFRTKKLYYRIGFPGYFKLNFRKPDCQACCQFLLYRQNKVYVTLVFPGMNALKLILKLVNSSG